MLPRTVKLRDIDHPIREFIIEMNNLPFVDTIFSCSGHLSKKPRPSQITYVGNGLYLNHGFVSFQVDDRYSIVPEFITRIEDETRMYPFVAFKQHGRGLLGELKDEGYNFFSGELPPEAKEYEEFAHKELEKFLQDFGRYSSHYFSIVATGQGLPFTNIIRARVRRKQFYELWRRLADVCREFESRGYLYAML